MGQPQINYNLECYQLRQELFKLRWGNYRSTVVMTRFSIFTHATAVSQQSHGNCISATESSSHNSCKFNNSYEEAHPLCLPSIMNSNQILVGKPSCLVVFFKKLLAPFLYLHLYQYMIYIYLLIYYDTYIIISYFNNFYVFKPSCLVGCFKKLHTVSCSLPACRSQPNSWIFSRFYHFAFLFKFPIFIISHLKSEYGKTESCHKFQYPLKNIYS